MTAEGETHTSRAMHAQALLQPLTSMQVMPSTPQRCSNREVQGNFLLQEVGNRGRICPPPTHTWLLHRKKRERLLRGPHLPPQLATARAKGCTGAGLHAAWLPSPPPRFSCLLRGECPELSHPSTPPTRHCLILHELSCF